MPVFTAIASIIVAEVGGIAFAAAVGSAGVAFATAVVAAGLAIVTARLVMGTGAQGGGIGSTQSQGTRVQLPPASENKIPVIYGTAFQQGIVTDAHISNSNKTMTYTLVLGEKTQTGNYSVGTILWNDQTLNFGSDGYTVESTTLADGSNSTTFNGLIRVWVWAGSSAAANQIFGPSSHVNAYDVIPDVDSTYMMNDLVFAVVQIDYNSEKNVTSLQNVTFEITNTLSNPGEVWYDYMTSTRYGAGFDASEIDSDTAIGSTSTSLKSISNQIPPNQFETDGVTTSTQVRYVCNGVINTVDTVKTNIDKINVASSSWTTYDHKLGKWRVIPNRAITNAEIENTFVFNDDNITGEISVSATNLEDIYNKVEVGYANRGLRDQTDYFKASIDAASLNDLEPVNLLRMTTALCNNGLHAGRIGLIELKQSRIDLLITFQSDYSGLQVEAGDVVRVTNYVYGFQEKLFRVTRVREAEGADGSLVAEITALEYDAEVFADSALEDGQSKPLSDLPTSGSSGTLPAPTKPTLLSINPGTPQTFTFRSQVQSTSGPVDVQQFWYSTSPGSGFVAYDTQYATGSPFIAGDYLFQEFFALPAGTYYIKARTGLGSQWSEFSPASDAFNWDPTFNYGPI